MTLKKKKKLKKRLEKMTQSDDISHHKKSYMYMRWWAWSDLPPLVDVENINITSKLPVLLIKKKRRRSKKQEQFNKFQFYLKNYFKPQEVFFVGRKKKVVAICNEYIILYAPKIPRAMKTRGGEFFKNALSTASDLIDLNR